MTVEAGWGWCRSCQCIFSFDAPDEWACATGGRHNRNADSAEPTRRCGNFSLPFVNIGASRSVPDPVLGAPSRTERGLVARWPLADSSEEAGGLETASSGDVFVIDSGANANEGYRFAGGAIRSPNFSFGPGEASTEVSLSWWMQPEAAPGASAGLFDHRCIGTGRDPEEVGLAVFLNNGSLGVKLSVGDEEPAVFASDRLPDTPRIWIGCVVTIGSSVTFYVNGERSGEVRSLPSGLRWRAASNADLIVGQLREGPSFAGKMTDVRIYRDAISQHDVRQLFDEGAWRVDDEPPAFGEQVLDGQLATQDWFKCKSCGLLVSDGVGLQRRASAQRCSAHRAGHEIEWRRRYTVKPQTGSLPEGALAGWTRCRNCAALHFAPFATQSWCTSGGPHIGDGTAYLLEPDQGMVPDFSQMDSRGGSNSILFLGANKDGHSQLGLAPELAFIQDALANHDIDLRGILTTRKRDVLEEIKENGPNIVQISAHGTDARPDAGIAPSEDDEWQAGGIWLLDDQEEMGLTTGAELAAIFAEAVDVHGSSIVDVVILNACRSVSKAELIAKHVEFVIAIEGDIPDKVAQVFAPMFYSAFAVSDGSPADRAGAALTKAQSMLGEFFEQRIIPQRVFPSKEPAV